MPRLLYSSLLYVLTPFILLRLWWRGRHAPAYRRRISERFGWLSALPEGRPALWVHAVSVGETLAAVPMIKALQREYPDHRLVVTTMTPTGSERVRAAFGDEVVHVYAPYDLPGAVRRFLNRVRPEMLIVMETELWPNIVAACARRDIPVVLANARLSEKSARGYARLGALTHIMLARLRAVAAQAEADGERFCTLGLPRDRLVITGNIKFDITLTHVMRVAAQAVRDTWQADGKVRSIWLAASTHEGEDEVVLAAHQRVLETCPEALLVLVPRHPERFERVFELCRQQGFSVARRSRDDSPTGCQVLLGDTMGELLTFYGACDIAFVGGSLVPNGGHSLIEPAAWGKPVLSGPHLFNFAEVRSQLETADALLLCDDAEQLSLAVGRLIRDADEAQERGRRARGVVESNRGALQRLLALLKAVIDQRTEPPTSWDRGSSQAP